MKVLLLNGSRKEKGCTYTALSEVAKALNEENIETIIVHAGDFSDENVKKAVDIMKESHGLVVGSPVYWASPSGEVIHFMDKFVSLAKEYLPYKPAAAIASARRAGTTATLDVLMKYMTYHQMPVVSSNYWPMVHGNSPEDVKKDEEGLQIMRILGKNMAWLMKCIDCGKNNGVNIPQKEQKTFTNFIK